MITAQDVMNRYNDVKLELAEGGSCIEQIEYFLTLLRKQTNVKQVLEIGFNGGLSASGILSAREDIHLISIDIGKHPYVLQAKEWIDRDFPGRHTLVIGDSMTALPKLMKLFPSFSPDLIFIDGGHDAPVPEADLNNSLQLARPDTWIILDDVVPWMVGILAPLNKLIEENKIHIFEQRREAIHGWLLLKKVC